jgi:hypothetical protein
LAYKVALKIGMSVRCALTVERADALRACPVPVKIFRPGVGRRRNRFVGGVQCVGTGLADLAVGSEVDGRGGVQSDPGVAVDVVVVGEEPLAERARVGE